MCSKIVTLFRRIGSSQNLADKFHFYGSSPSSHFECSSSVEDVIVSYSNVMYSRDILGKHL